VPNALGEPIRGATIGEIGFGQYDAVGERRLVARFRARSRLASQRGIDHGYQRLQMKFAGERPLAGEGLQHRARISEAAGLDDHPLEARHRTACPIGE